jgi:hypothetical protein
MSMPDIGQIASVPFTICPNGTAQIIVIVCLL